LDGQEVSTNVDFTRPALSMMEKSAFVTEGLQVQGQRRNAAATKGRLLASARRRFLQDSYENVSLREVSSDANVDVALVGRYFGSKEELFRQVLCGPNDEWLNQLAKADDFAAHLAILAVDGTENEDGDRMERLLIILRSMSSPQAASLAHDSFQEEVLHPLANLLAGPASEMRAGIALAVLMGTTIVRGIMNLQPLSGCDRDALLAKLTRLLRVAIAEQPDGSDAEPGFDDHRAL